MEGPTANELSLFGLVFVGAAFSALVSWWLSRTAVSSAKRTD